MYQTFMSKMRKQCVHQSSNVFATRLLFGGRVARATSNLFSPVLNTRLIEEMPERSLHGVRSEDSIIGGEGPG